MFKKEEELQWDLQLQFPWPIWSWMTWKNELCNLMMFSSPSGKDK